MARVSMADAETVPDALLAGAFLSDDEAHALLHEDWDARAAIMRPRSLNAGCTAGCRMAALVSIF